MLFRSSVPTIGAVCRKNLIISEGDFSVMLKMEESGPHQTAMGPYQVDASLHQAESGGSQHSNPFASLQHRGDHEGRAHITHTSRSLSRGKGHVSHARNDRDV